MQLKANSLLKLWRAHCARGAYCCDITAQMILTTVFHRQVRQLVQASNGKGVIEHCRAQHLMADMRTKQSRCLVRHAATDKAARHLDPTWCCMRQGSVAFA